MPKTFNITAVCRPAIHYMADIGRQVSSIKKFVDNGQYFVINRPRQYGKTTILHALAHILQSSYYVVLLDFQKISQSKLENENKFCVTFAKMFLKSLERNKIEKNSNIKKAVSDFIINMEKEKENFELPELFENLLNICGIPERPFVLIIDKIDSASGSQVFLDFLAQLRAAYIDSSFQKTFHSVILAGVHDIKNLKRKIRPEEDHNINSPWNIAANFDVDLSLTEYSIRDMLKEYEKDYNTGMDINTMAELIYSYTSGYPFLVSRLCKFMDEEITQDKNLKTNA